MDSLESGRELAKGLSLRCAEESDIPSILEHVAIVHGKKVVPVVKRVISHFPDFPIEDNFIAVDGKTQRIVSHLCLLRKRCVFCGTELPYGQMEFVGTHPDYRGRGLIRELNRMLEQKVAEYRLPFVVIAGIPYFYRQFGYEYAIPLGGGRGLLTIPMELIPAAGQPEPVTIEKVQQSTFSAYLRCRRERNSYLGLHRVLDLRDWDCLSEGRLGEDDEANELYLVQQNGRPVGTFFLHVGWGRLQVFELWLENVAVIASVLRFLKAVARDRNLPLAFELPSNPTLTSTLEGITNSRFPNQYAWYVRIPSIKQFLEDIAPVLETRVAASEFETMSDTFRLGWYREGVDIAFDRGTVVGMREQDGEGSTRSDLHVPPLVVNQLMLGYRTLDQLVETYPDARIEPSKERLAQVLFPAIRANLTPEM